MAAFSQKRSLLFRWAGTLSQPGRWYSRTAPFPSPTASVRKDRALASPWKAWMEAGSTSVSRIRFPRTPSRLSAKHVEVTYESFKAYISLKTCSDWKKKLVWGWRGSQGFVFQLLPLIFLLLFFLYLQHKPASNQIMLQTDKKSMFLVLQSFPVRFGTFLYL